MCISRNPNVYNLCMFPLRPPFHCWLSSPSIPALPPNRRVLWWFVRPTALTLHTQAVVAQLGYASTCGTAAGTAKFPGAVFVGGHRAASHTMERIIPPQIRTTASPAAQLCSNRFICPSVQCGFVSPEPKCIGNGCLFCFMGGRPTGKPSVQSSAGLIPVNTLV